MDAANVLTRFFCTPAEPLDQAWARGDALVTDAELAALPFERIELGITAVHPSCYRTPRSYLPVLSERLPEDIAGVARYERYLWLGHEDNTIREVISSEEAQRELERDPDMRYSLMTGRDAIDQYLYGAARTLPAAERELARAEADTSRVFPPAERRAWRIARARRRRDLLRALIAQPQRAAAMSIFEIPLVPAEGPWAARHRAMAPAYARVRETAAAAESSWRATNAADPVVCGAVQRAVEALFALATRAE